MNSFYSMAHSCGISDKEILSVLKFLVQLGTIVYYDDQKIHMDSFIIIDPLWLNKFMTTLITTKPNFTHNGILGRKDMDQIWRPPAYPSHIFPALVSLLTKFEIAFVLPEKNFLIPALLPSNRPVIPNMLGQIYRQERTYVFYTNHYGFFSRLMVRLFYLMDGLQYWQTGILLKKETTEATLEYKPQSQRMQVRVWGEQSIKYLRLIMDSVETLLVGWYSSNFNIIVPCVCADCAPSETSQITPLPSFRSKRSSKRMSQYFPVSPFPSAAQSPSIGPDASSPMRRLSRSSSLSQVMPPPVEPPPWLYTETPLETTMEMPSQLLNGESPPNSPVHLVPQQPQQNHLDLSNNQEVPLDSPPPSPPARVPDFYKSLFQMESDSPKSDSPLGISPQTQLSVLQLRKEPELQPQPELQQQQQPQTEQQQLKEPPQTTSATPQPVTQETAQHQTSQTANSPHPQQQAQDSPQAQTSQSSNASAPKKFLQNLRRGTILSKQSDSKNKTTETRPLPPTTQIKLGPSPLSNGPSPKNPHKAPARRMVFLYKDCELALANGWKIIKCSRGKLVALSQVVPELTLADVAIPCIVHNSLNIGKEIARGAFGSVHQATYKGEEVAIKIIRPGDHKLVMLREFRREVWLASSLTHPCIVQLKAFSLHPASLVMEYVPYGSLYDFLHNTPPAELSWCMKLNILANIADAMRFLHGLTPKICHRDLKSPNCLMKSLTTTGKRCSDDIVCKLADFGESRTLVVSAIGRDNLGNPAWMAPEIMRGEGYSEKADVFSFGIIAWEVLTHTDPYSEFEISKSRFTFQFEDAIIQGLRPTIPPGVNEEYPQPLMPHFLI